MSEVSGPFPCFDYNFLIAEFESTLVDKLRGAGASAPELELWVPDPDPVKSLTNMVQSLGASGVWEFTVLIDAGMLENGELTRLQAAVADYAGLKVCRKDDRLHMAFFLHDGDVSIDRAVVDRQADEYVVAIDADHVAAEMSPPLKRIALAAANAAMHVRDSPPEGSGWVTVKAEDGRDWIAIQSSGDGEAVCDVCFGGVEDRVFVGVLEIFSEALNGKPLSEVVDHGVIRTLEIMSERAGGRDVSGILLPFNSGPQFIHLRDMLGKLSSEIGERPARGYDDRPAPAWLDNGQEKRLAQIEAAVRKFEQLKAIPSETIVVDGLRNDLDDWPVRIFVQMNDMIPIEHRAEVVRDLEGWLKEALERKLQVYYQERRDGNRIRRL